MPQLFDERRHRSACRRSVCRGQHRLRLDPTLEILVQPLDRVGGEARSSPKARNEAGALAVALLDPFRVMRLGARTSHMRTVIMERLGVGAVRGSENARVA
jgi:hypothetical protein